MKFTGASVCPNNVTVIKIWKDTCVVGEIKVKEGRKEWSFDKKTLQEITSEMEEICRVQERLSSMI